MVKKAEDQAQEEKRQMALQVRDTRVFAFMDQLEKAEKFPVEIRSGVVGMLNEKIKYMMDWETSEMISNSELVPADYKGKPNNVFLAIQTGRSLGLDPFQSVKHLYTVNGRTGLFGDMMLALAKKHPDYIDCLETHGDLIEVDGKHIKMPQWTQCVVKIKGKEDVLRIYPLEKAMRNPNFNNNIWCKDGDRMMQMRARSIALRDAFPDKLSGVYDEYEIQEVRETKDISDQVEDLGATSGSDALKDSLKDEQPETQAEDIDITPEDTEEESEESEQKKPENIRQIKKDFAKWATDKKITKEDYDTFIEKGNLGEWDKVVDAHKHFSKEFPPEEEPKEPEKLGEFAQKLSEIVDKEEYQRVIKSLIEDKNLKHITAKRAEKILRTTDEKKAKEIFELLKERLDDLETDESR